MQFEYSATVLSATRVTVEGRTFASIFVGEQAQGEQADNVRGFSVRKIPCDPVVFDQLTDLVHGQPKSKTLLMILKQAAQGKSQPHVVGIAPDTSSAKPSQGTTK